MFMCKAWCLPPGGITVVDSNLASEHEARMEIFAMDKHSSLFSVEENLK